MLRRVTNNVGRWVIVGGVWFYRGTLGLVMAGHCRYIPTCSEYMLEAVEKYGPWRGGWRGIKRVARCHPMGGAGYDPP